MCQAIRDGGRRCPKHQHISRATLMGVAAKHGLTNAQAESLLAELRREGRNTELPEANVLQANLKNVVDSVSDETVSLSPSSRANLREQYQKFVDTNESAQVDGATYYALQTIDARAKQRKETLNRFLSGIADTTGLTKAQILLTYKNAMSETDTTRNGEVPEEYTITTRAQAVRAGLPYDRASVVATEKLKKLPITQRRRIERVAVPGASQIASYGYDDGRLEVTLRDNDETVLAYQNVPATLYNRMVDSSRPARIFATLRQDPDYQYASASDAERDAFRYRCAACGQFAAATGHSCPEREQNEVVATQAVLNATENNETPSEVSNDSTTIDALSVAIAQVNHIDLTEVDEVTNISEEERAEIVAEEAEVAAIPVEVIEEVNPMTDEEENEAATDADNVVQPATTTPHPEIPTVNSLTGDNLTQEEKVQRILTNSLLGLDNDPHNLLGLTEEERVAKATQLGGILFPENNETLESQVNGTWENSTEPFNVDEHEVGKGYAIPHNVFYPYRALADNYSNVIRAETLQAALRDIPENSYDYRVMQLQRLLDVSDMTREDITSMIEDSNNQGRTTRFALVPNPSQANPEGVKLIPVDIAKTRVTVKNYSNKNIRFTARVSNTTSAVTPSDASAIREEESRNLTALINQEKAVTVAPVSTFKSSVRVPSTKFKLGKVTDLRKALKDNPDKIIIADAGIKMSNDVGVHSSIPLVAMENTRGYRASRRGDDSSVEGKIAFRRTSEGKIEVVSSRSLKCDCSKYRERYYCEHVYYAKHRLSTLIHEALPSETVQMARGGFGEDGILRKPDNLANRENIIVAQNTNESGETEGEQFYKFTNNVAGNMYNRSVTKVFSRPRRGIFTVPGNDRPTTAFTAGTVLGADNFDQVSRHFMLQGFAESVVLPKALTGMKALLGKANVEVPIVVNSTKKVGRWGLGDDIVTQGTVMLKKLERGENKYVADSSNLRCNCPEYVSNNYHCVHTRMIIENTDQLFRMHSPALRNDYYPENREESLDSLQVQDRETLINLSNDFNEITHSRNRGEYVTYDTETNQLHLNAAGEAYIAEVRQERINAEIARAAAEQRRREEQLERERAREQEIRERNAETVAASEAYRANMLQRWENVDPGYTENPDQFYNDYKAALKRKRDGDSPVPFVTENVTDGICAEGEGTRSFGIEIEFDFPNNMDSGQKATSIRNIGRELKEAGLTSTADQQRYHAASGTGWAEWSFERDATVSGEIVSPLMKDTPEHWEQLRKVCEIVNRNGGIASKRTGSHVHISTGSYETNTAKHAELLRQTTEHQETLFRLASDPKRGSHRGTQWCAPNAEDNLSEELSHEGGQHTHREFLRGNNSHGVAMNFQGTGNETYKKSHVEFRMWDGTIDPAVIQQQVAISAAMTDVAEKTVMQEGKSKRKAREEQKRIGSLRREELASLDGNPRKTHTKDTLVATSAPAMQFMDKFFRKQEDRERIAALFAVTNWVG